MIPEQDILDLGFVRQDYSTDEEQYYLIDTSRVGRWTEYDAHQEYKLTANSTDTNKYKLESTLKLGQHYFAHTNAWYGNWTTVEELEAVLTKMVIWDYQH